MTEKNEKPKSEEQKNQTQTNDSQETQAEQNSAKVEEQVQNQEIDTVEKASEVVEQEHPSSEEFKVPLYISEKKYYENIVASQAETIRKLRAENMELRSKLDSTKEE